MPRCEHSKKDGTRCKKDANANGKYCTMHETMVQRGISMSQLSNDPMDSEETRTEQHNAHAHNEDDGMNFVLSPPGGKKPKVGSSRDAGVLLPPHVANDDAAPAPANSASDQSNNSDNDNDNADVDARPRKSKNEKAEKIAKKKPVAKKKAAEAAEKETKKATKGKKKPVTEDEEGDDSSDHDSDAAETAYLRDENKILFDLVKNMVKRFQKLQRLYAKHTGESVKIRRKVTEASKIKEAKRMFYQKHKLDDQVVEELAKTYPNLNEGPYAPGNIPWQYVYNVTSCMFDGLPLVERNEWINKASVKLACMTLSGNK